MPKTKATKEYVENEKDIKKDDPMIVYVKGQKPELGFYAGFGHNLNIYNDDEPPHGLLVSDIEDVDKLVVFKPKSRK